jgi:hypothetical protein
MTGTSGPEPAINMLTLLWTKKAAEVSKDLYKRIEGEWLAWMHAQVSSCLGLKAWAHAAKVAPSCEPLCPSWMVTCRVHVHAKHTY